jgi:hypothetical protein
MAYLKRHLLYCEYTKREWCAVKTFQDGVHNVVEGINKI